MKNFPWIRTGLILAVAGYSYYEFTKEPIVYEPMNITQVYAGRDTLSGHHLRITGIPSPASYARISDNKAALSFVLSDSNGSHITCYAKGKIDDRNLYLQAKALLDHASNNSDSYSYCSFSSL